MRQVTLTSRAFHNTLMGPLLQRLCKLTRLDRAMLMNSGAEAVETAIKAMRLWGYRVKGIPQDQAQIIVFEGNFHGRTTTIVGFSSDRGSREGFGPSTPGFRMVPYGDLKALEEAITSNTCGVLIEPIQGEAGVRIPPAGYLKGVRALCSERNVLLCADEIQTGLGRTGAMFCAEHERVRPDIVIMGKALSGGFYPVSAIAARSEVMILFSPGTHGSTFGGNPLACAIAMASLDVIEKERLAPRAAALGRRFLAGLRRLKSARIKEVRGKGLLCAIEFNEPIARAVCESLMGKGLLAKDAHDTSLRLAPPLVITQEQLDLALGLLQAALDELPPQQA